MTLFGNQRWLSVSRLDDNWRASGERQGDDCGLEKVTGNIERRNGKRGTKGQVAAMRAGISLKNESKKAISTLGREDNEPNLF